MSTILDSKILDLHVISWIIMYLEEYILLFSEILFLNSVSCLMTILLIRQLVFSFNEDLPRCL